MAYQFLHVESYTISDAKGVALEASRESPDHCRHVDNPTPPIQIEGLDPIAFLAKTQSAVSDARDTVTMKNGKVAERKLRSDTKTYFTGVMSYPTLTSELCEEERQSLMSWADESISWFKEFHGIDNEISAVMHLDEKFPHIHIHAAPDLASGQRMYDIHAGEKAKKAIGGKHAKKTDKDRAYVEAMRGMQDDYQENVCVKYAMSRLGPQRQRLTRKEWQSQQQQQQLIAKQMIAAKAVNTKALEVESLSKELTKEKTEIAKKHNAIFEERQKLKGLGYKIGLALGALTGATGRVKKKLVSKYQKQLKSAQMALKLAQSEESKAKKAVNEKEEVIFSLSNKNRSLESDLTLSESEKYRYLGELGDVRRALERGELRDARVAIGLDDALKGQQEKKTITRKGPDLDLEM